ncbi:MAG: lasso peptide biosynthesis B2 protein [Acidobacteriota bacterium]|nr:lasso peptide biosynthesis B2 protein [Acidobacteriota bacterium]
MAGWILVLSLVVRLYSLPQALRIISTSRKSKPPSRKDQGTDLATAFASAIDALLAINLFVFKPVCWKRAAVLHRYLALHGAPTRILFGVRKGTSGALTGHAWLEAEGEPILEAELPNYTVTYTFPSNEAFDGNLALLAKRSVN